MSTTTTNKVNEDIHNLEHSGEWDHGVEPDVLAVSNSADDDNLKENEAGTFAGPKRLIQQAQNAISNVWHNLSEQVAETTRKDEHFKAEVEGHTEEEVAGMKLCVSKTIHQDSFIAPC
jgi:hypothetical protein